MSTLPLSPTRLNSRIVSFCSYLSVFYPLLTSSLILQILLRDLLSAARELTPMTPVRRARKSEPRIGIRRPQRAGRSKRNCDKSARSIKQESWRRRTFPQRLYKKKTGANCARPESATRPSFVLGCREQEHAFAAYKINSSVLSISRKAKTTTETTKTKMMTRNTTVKMVPDNWNCRRSRPNAHKAKTWSCANLGRPVQQARS